MTEHKTVALVTGASAGLGAEFCRQLASRCEVIIAVARRGERLGALAEALRGRVELHPLAADLNTVEGVARTIEALRQLGPVDILVNNAGFATAGRFRDEHVDGQLDMVGLHIEATVRLCRAAIPFMAERGAGAIINVSSLGAFLPAGKLAVYGASKAFLNHFSEALQLELKGTGICVQCLCPGPVSTGLHTTGGAESDALEMPAEQWMEAPAVVAASLAALATKQVLVVPGDSNRSLAQAGVQQLLQRLQE